MKFILTAPIYAIISLTNVHHMKFAIAQTSDQLHNINENVMDDGKDPLLSLRGGLNVISQAKDQNQDISSHSKNESNKIINDENVSFQPNGSRCSSVGSCNSRFCQAGTCQACLSNNDCEPDRVCSGGRCVTVQDERVCSGNTDCLAHYVCINRVCRPDYFPPFCGPSNSVSLSNGCRCNTDAQCSSRYCIGLTCIDRPPTCGAPPSVPNGCSCNSDLNCVTGFCTKPLSNGVGYCSSRCTSNAQCPSPSPGCDLRSGQCLESSCPSVNAGLGCPCRLNTNGVCANGLYCSASTSPARCSQCPSVGTNFPNQCPCVNSNQCLNNSFCSLTSRQCTSCPSISRPQGCPCSLTSECGTGLFCDGRTCQPAGSSCKEMYSPCNPSATPKECCEGLDCLSIKGQPPQCINP